MDTNITKEHFSKLCDSLFTDLHSISKYEEDLQKELLLLVAKMAMLAWNAVNVCQNKAEAKKLVRLKGRDAFKGDKDFLGLIFEVIEIKWDEYRDDDGIIEAVSVDYVDGKPKVTAYLEGEHREPDTSPDAFQRYMNSPEIRNRLASVPPDKFNEEMAKIVDEFNAEGKR